MSEAANPFAEKMVTILNHGALNLAMGLGYRLGLFDVLDALEQPGTLAQICADAGLDRHYVREWLGVMVCGEIVELVEKPGAESRYRLPRDHGDLLARRAGSNNLGVYTQEIPLLTACAMQPVAEGFVSGDGVGYRHYPDFHDFMGQLADAKHRRTLVEEFLPTVEDGRLIARLERGIEVCDLGCAQGLAVILMAQAFPASRFTGIDISAQALAVARRAAAEARLTNVRFECCDAAELKTPNDLSATFDYITAFDAIHDQTRPNEALAAVVELLRPDGAFSMIDIAAESDLAGNRDHPMGAFLYAVSLMHCMPVGKVDGGAGLGMMWGRQQAEQMLARAGFKAVAVTPIPGDAFNLHYYCTT